jgi:hypothetical protein
VSANNSGHSVWSSAKRLDADLLRQAGVLLEQVDQSRRVAGDAGVGDLGRHHQRLDLGLQPAPSLAQRLRDPARSLDADLDGAVGKGNVLQDGRHHADVVDVVGPRLVLLRVTLGDQEDPLPGLLQGALQRGDRGRPPDHEGGFHVREHHHVPQRHQR